MRATLLLLTGCVTNLTVSQPAATGDRAAPFTLPSQSDTRVSLGTEPTVLVFYRGFW